MGKTPEGKVKADIDAAIAQLPKKYRYCPPSTIYGRRAIDRFLCVNGRFVGIEAKAPGKRPTKLQERTLKEIIDAGGAAFWCDSVESFLINMRLWGLLPDVPPDRLWEKRWPRADGAQMPKED